MMHFSIKEIAAAIGGHIHGNAALEIEGASGLDDASDKDISFFHNLKYGEALNRTKAGAVIVPAELPLESSPPSKTFIKVQDPKWAFAQVLGLFDQGRVRHPETIHPRAIIAPEAQVGPRVGIGPHVVVERGSRIGSGTRLYPGVYIGERCTIGENCLIYPNVTLREDTVLGNNVIIHAGTVLGSDGYGYATHQGRHHKIPQIGRVVVENDVEIGANVAIDRATTGETRIGEGTKIDNLVHIAHNVQIGKHCFIVAQVGISGSTKVGNYVTLAGQVGLVGHITVGDRAVIAAQSGIMNDVKSGEVLFGSPARPHRETLKLQALYAKLPEIYDICRELKKKFLKDSE